MSLSAGPQRSLEPRAKPTLNDQEKRGQGLFLQRCSVCHLPGMNKAKLDAIPSFGPSLTLLFKDSNPDKEATLLEVIRRGSQNMPGFQYGLTPQEINDIITYLKAL
jgi:mono/diheme cytochrome c family protein